MAEEQHWEINNRDMIMGDSTKTMTWRQLLRSHGGRFLKWLGNSGAEVRALARIANELEEFLMREVERVQHEWPDAPVEFWCIISSK